MLSSYTLSRGILQVKVVLIPSLHLWLAFPLLCVCAHVCACTYTYVRGCTCVCIEARSQSLVIWRSCPPCFLRQGLSWPRPCLSRVGWLVGRPQRVSPLQLSITGITNALPTPGFSHGSWNSNLSSCLHGKHFIGWIFFLLSILLMLILDDLNFLVVGFSLAFIYLFCV